MEGNDFLIQRVLAKNCDSTRWLEVGWGEVGWRGDVQYVFTYDSVQNQWLFFDQYPIAAGSRIWVALVHVGGGTWQAQLWWNGAWQVLSSVNPGPDIGCGNENYVEPHAGSTGAHFPFPSIQIGDGTAGGMQLASGATATWQTWDVPSLENNDDGTGDLTTAWFNRYYYGRIDSNLSDSIGYSDDPVSSSSDGRYVAFESDATNLVSGDTNGLTDIFVRDRTAGTTTRVSLTGSGAQATGGASHSPAVSSDGRYVAFHSLAGNLVSGDTNGFADIFVRDRTAGTTSRISVNASGAQSNAGSYDPVVSADGRYVAFESNAALVGTDANGVRDVYVRDRTGATTTWASGGSNAPNNGRSFNPTISSDGRFVAFESASALWFSDTNGVSDIYEYDRSTGTTSRLSIDDNLGAANDSSFSPAMSADGVVAGFITLAPTFGGADCVAGNNLGETARSFISRCRKGSINREFPSELLDWTLEQIRNCTTAACRKAWKLLNDNRFKKPNTATHQWNPSRTTCTVALVSVPG